MTSSPKLCSTLERKAAAEHIRRLESALAEHETNLALLASHLKCERTYASVREAVDRVIAEESALSAERDRAVRDRETLLDALTILSRRCDRAGQ